MNSFKQLCFTNSSDNLVKNNIANHDTILDWMNQQIEYIDNLDLNLRAIIILSTYNIVNEPIRNLKSGLTLDIRLIQYIIGKFKEIDAEFDGIKQHCPDKLKGVLTDNSLKIMVDAIQKDKRSPYTIFNDYIVTPLKKIISDAPPLPVNMRLFRMTDGTWPEFIHDSKEEFKSFTLSLRGYKQSTLENGYIFKTDLLSQTYYCNDAYFRNLMSVNFKQGQNALYLGKYSLGSVNEILVTDYYYEFKQKLYSKDLLYNPIMSKFDVDQGNIRRDVNSLIDQSKIIQIIDNDKYSCVNNDYNNGFFYKDKIKIKINIIECNAVTEKENILVDQYLKHLDKGLEIYKQGENGGVIPWEKIYLNDVVQHYLKDFDISKFNDNANVSVPYLLNHISKKPYMCKISPVHGCSYGFLDGSSIPHSPNVERPNHGVLNHYRSFVIAVIQLKLYLDIPKFKRILNKELSQTEVNLLILSAMFKSMLRMDENRLPREKIYNIYDSRKKDTNFEFLFPILTKRFPILKDKFKESTYNMHEYSSAVLFMSIVKTIMMDQPDYPVSALNCEIITLSLTLHFDHLIPGTESQNQEETRKLLSSLPEEFTIFFILVNCISSGSHYIDHCRAGESLPGWVATGAGCLESEPFKTLHKFMNDTNWLGKNKVEIDKNYSKYYLELLKNYIYLLLFTEYEEIYGGYRYDDPHVKRKIFADTNIVKLLNNSNIFCSTFNNNHRFKGNFERFSNDVNTLIAETSELWEPIYALFMRGSLKKNKKTKRIYRKNKNKKNKTKKNKTKKSKKRKKSRTEKSKTKKSKT